MGIDLPSSAFNWYSPVRLTLIMLPFFYYYHFFLSDLLFATTGSAAIRLTTVSQATKK